MPEQLTQRPRRLGVRAERGARRSPRMRGDTDGRPLVVTAPMALPLLGVISWVAGLSLVHPGHIGLYGLLLGTGGAGGLILLGIVLVVAGFLCELRGRARSWWLAACLIGLIVEINAAVPILFGTPEYSWVYKHLGIIAGFQRFGRVTDPANIYQAWPVLFAGVAGLSSLAHVPAASLATWAPLTFELADALLLMAIFRLLARGPRIAWLALLLYEGLISWVGQDYLSPQAFAYLLYLALTLIVLRWLRAPVADLRIRAGRWRLPLPTGPTGAGETTRTMRAIAVALALLVYFAITAAHQLTPFVALADVAVLTLLGQVRPRWLVLALAAIAGVYLAWHYQLIASQYGGLFSGGNPVTNGAGVKGAYHAGAEATTAWIVRLLAVGMWGLVAVSVLADRRRLGKIFIVPAALALTPFVILGAQSYGGEAIYRVYLFSAPWCALLIAMVLYTLAPGRLRAIRWPLIIGASLAALLGLQGLYGPVAVDAFPASELRASAWLYAHVPRGSLIIFPDDDFPGDEAADSPSYEEQLMPADPLNGMAWMNEGDLRQVTSWIASLHPQPAYVVLSTSMRTYADYFGSPVGYDRLASALPRGLSSAVVYRNASTTIYRLKNAAQLQAIGRRGIPDRAAGGDS